MLKKHNPIRAMIFCLALTLVFASCGKKKGQEEFEKGMAAFAVKDYKTAMTRFESAAGQGHDEAQYYLGLCCAKGFGVKKDMDKAFKWYSQAAEKGNAKAMLDLAVSCYMEGKGVKKDVKKAYDLIEKAADKGEPDAMWILGEQYIAGIRDLSDPGVKKAEKVWEKAFDIYRERARKGDTSAMCRVGRCYLRGRGVTKDTNEYVKWIRKAADSGDGAAMFELGDIYFSGRYLYRDIDEAVEWYAKAAENGELSAMLKLGGLYERGDKVEKDLEYAVIWYAQAAETGDETAFSRLLEIACDNDPSNSLAAKLAEKAIRDTIDLMDENSAAFARLALGIDDDDAGNMTVDAAEAADDRPMEEEAAANKAAEAAADMAVDAAKD